MIIRIINGPNLNLLGNREPHLYGSVSFDDYYKLLQQKFAEVEFSFFQSNVEGELINKIQQWGFNSNAIILNAGGYTHTSVAIADAVAAINTPCIEVHISNLFAREEIRHRSLLSQHCIGIISGFGLAGYALAIEYFLEKLNKKNPLF